MKKQDFLNAVEHEVRTLKELATKEELKNLNLNTFEPKHEFKCIYGQMTGHCGGERSKELMDQACIIVTNCGPLGVEGFYGKSFSNVKNLINGKNTGQGWRDHIHRNYSHLSALEAYICLKDAKIKNVISFLKGESNKLVL